MSNSNQQAIVLIGCGKWGQYILRDLKTLDCHVTVVCRSPESIARAQQYGADQVIDSISKIDNATGIVIATPTSTHLDVIASVLKYDLPLFVEKPLGIQLEKAHKLIKQAGDRIFIMDKWRYHPGVEELSSIAKTKGLGEVFGVRTKQYGWGCAHSDTDFIDVLLPHSLMIGYEILGEIPNIQKAYATRRNKQPVSLSALFGHQPYLNINIATNYYSAQREIVLECAHGLAVLNDGYSDTIDIYPTPDSYQKNLSICEKRPIDTEWPLFRELRTFVNYLKGGDKPKTNGYHGVKVLEHMLEVREVVQC